MGDELDQEIEAVLRDVGVDPIPAPREELVARILRRIRSRVVLDDLLRFVTFEGLWRSVSGADDDARLDEERQDLG